MAVRIEQLARRVELGDALALEQRPERAMHQRDAIGDRLVLGRLEGAERTLEVVEHGQEIVEQPLGGPLAELLVLARHALLVVVELGGEPPQLVEVLIAIALAAGGTLKGEAELDKAFGGPEEIGRLFLTDHLIAFEVTSIVLLIAAVGGVVLGSHARRGEADRRAEAEALAAEAPAAREEGA